MELFSRLNTELNINAIHVFLNSWVSAGIVFTGIVLITKIFLSHEKADRSQHHQGSTVSWVDLLDWPSTVGSKLERSFKNFYQVCFLFLGWLVHIPPLQCSEGKKISATVPTQRSSATKWPPPPVPLNLIFFVFFNLFKIYAAAFIETINLKTVDGEEVPAKACTNHAQSLACLSFNFLRLDNRQRTAA